MSLQEARKLAATVLSAAANTVTTAVPAAKPGKGAAKAEPALGPVPAQAMAQLKDAAEACEAAMGKLSSASNAAGLHCSPNHNRQALCVDFSQCPFAVGIFGKGKGLVCTPLDWAPISVALWCCLTAMTLQACCFLADLPRM